MTPPGRYSELVLGLHALIGTLVTLIPAAAAVQAPRDAPVVEVDGSRLVDQNGEAIQLRGVNRSGTEYSCVQGLGIFDGPVDDSAIAAMRSWELNSIRIPLNEDCWLGAAGLDPESSGEPHRKAISAYVERLTGAGLVVILDLHWTGTNDEPAIGQQSMANSTRSIDFWRSVATVFRDREGIVFDVFNEPHDITWRCWRDGCGANAGMQSLVDAIRSAGATHPIILSGLDWGADLSGWARFKPRDTAGALVAGVHLYDFKDCSTPECWSDEIGEVSERWPVVITEFGDTDCNADFSGSVMSWADSAQVSYLAWTWNPWDCAGGPALVSAFDGSATPYGEVVKARFQARAPVWRLPGRLPGGALPS